MKKPQKEPGTSSNSEPTVPVVPYNSGDEDSEYSDEYSAQSWDSERTLFCPDLCVLTDDEHWTMTPETHIYAAAAGSFCFSMSEDGDQQDTCNLIRGFQDKTEKSTYRLIPLLPQDLDFACVAIWQPARDGPFFCIWISEQLFFKDNLMMWTVMLCVNYHQKQVILHTLLQDWREPAYGMNDAPRRWWNILDKALCSCGMVPKRADRCCHVLYSRAWANRSKRTITQWNDTGNISNKPRLRTEVDCCTW